MSSMKKGYIFQTAKLQYGFLEAHHPSLFLLGRSSEERLQQRCLEATSNVIQAHSTLLIPTPVTLTVYVRIFILINSIVAPSLSSFDPLPHQDLDIYKIQAVAFPILSGFLPRQLHLLGSGIVPLLLLFPSCHTSIYST